MEVVFIKIVNMSITASWLILALLIIRLLFRRLPKRIVCFLWALVGIRLICPISFSSVFSLIPSSETVPSNIAYQKAPSIDSGISIVNETVNPIIEENFTPSPTDSANPLQIVIAIAAAVWLIGIIVFLIYALVSYLRLKRTVTASVAVGDHITACDEVSAPFILGVIDPRIYIPSGAREETLCYVIKHEEAHLRRHDNLWKPLGFLILAIHWFNPLCWLSYVLFCRDIEMACDESVIRTMGKEEIAAYSQALLDYSSAGKKAAICPVAFAEVGVKDRIRSVLNYRKPTFWIIIISVMIILCIAVFLMTDPASGRNIGRKLAESMDAAMAQRYRVVRTGWRYDATDYDVLRVSKTKDETTVYAIAVYESFLYENGDIKNESGTWIPTVITFDTSDGADAPVYNVIEYWEPRDGDLYAADIRDRFPRSLWRTVLKTSGAQKQQENCMKTAQEYFSGISHIDSQKDDVSSLYEACAFIALRDGHYNIGVEIHTNGRSPEGPVLIGIKEFKGYVKDVEDVPDDGRYYCRSGAFSNDFKEWDTFDISEGDIDEVISIMKDHVYRLGLEDPERNYEPIAVETKLDVVVDIEKEKSGEKAVELSVPSPRSMMIPVRDYQFISRGYMEGTHPGLDFAGQNGVDVFSSYEGVVRVTGYDDDRGNYIVIEHGGDILTEYDQLKEIIVESGTYVERGTLIGYLGDTGKATGPHLCFRIIDGDKYVDPEIYLESLYG